MVSLGLDAKASYPKLKQLEMLLLIVHQMLSLCVFVCVPPCPNCLFALNTFGKAGYIKMQKVF